MATVIPAQAGIHFSEAKMGPRLREDDNERLMFRSSLPVSVSSRSFSRWFE
jgi:hypothetical protein